jgi:hypothetical protein
VIFDHLGSFYSKPFPVTLDRCQSLKSCRVRHIIDSANINNLAQLQGDRIDRFYFQFDIFMILKN